MSRSLRSFGTNPTSALIVLSLALSGCGDRQVMITDDNTLSTIMSLLEDQNQQIDALTLQVADLQAQAEAAEDAGTDDSDTGDTGDTSDVAIPLSGLVWMDADENILPTGLLLADDTGYFWPLDQATGEVLIPTAGAAFCEEYTNGECHGEAWLIDYRGTVPDGGDHYGTVMGTVPVVDFVPGQPFSVPGVGWFIAPADRVLETVDATADGLCQDYYLGDDYLSCSSTYGSSIVNVIPLSDLTSLGTLSVPDSPYVGPLRQVDASRL